LNCGSKVRLHCLGVTYEKKGQKAGEMPNLTVIATPKNQLTPQPEFNPMPIVALSLHCLCSLFATGTNKRGELIICAQSYTENLGKNSLNKITKFKFLKFFIVLSIF
jgi:hypothetical protein